MHAAENQIYTLNKDLNPVLYALIAALCRNYANEVRSPLRGGNIQTEKLLQLHVEVQRIQFHSNLEATNGFKGLKRQYVHERG